MAKKAKKTKLEKQEASDEPKDVTKKKAKAEVEEDSGIPEYEQRTKEWRDDEDVQKQVEEIYSAVRQGFDDKTEHNNSVDRFWDIYNCTLNENQGYDGTSKIYLGLVRDAIEARVTRFVGSLFPSTGRYSDVISTDGVAPYETMAMTDYYVKACMLRESVLPSLVRTGDVCGQYTIFVSWKKRRRHTIQKKLVPTIGDEKTGEVGRTGAVGDVEIVKVNEDMPDVMVVDSRNLCILPVTVDDPEDADIVALALRLTKTQVQDYIDDGTFDEDAGEELLDNFSVDQKDNQPGTEKKAAEAAGIKTDSSGSKTALVYMMYAKVKIGGKRRRCLIYQGGENLTLSCKRNPLWSDRLPILSAPAKKVPGTIWGKSGVEPVEDSQYAANDAVNMAFDSAKFSVLPIVMSDPEKNPRTGTMILTMGALWQVDPSSVKFAEFAPLWREAIALAELCGGQIEKSLGVNPSMIPQGNKTNKKPSQAQVSQEQQVANESTVDAVTIIENAILNKLLQLFYEFDYQYRDKDLMIRQFGPMGMQAYMQRIPPAEVGKHYDFKWFGVEGAKNAQQIQQGISLLNVLSKIPPQLLNGRKLDAGPLVDQLALDTYGPKLASKVVIDQRHQLTIPPQLENEMLVGGFKVPVQQMDDDVAHLQSHKAAMQITGDETGALRQHMMEHIMQLSSKQSQGGGPQGVPKIGGPRPGAQVQPPTGPQNPAGTIHPDNIQDPGAMPRQRQ